jgi:hypothetical protein
MIDDLAKAKRFRELVIALKKQNLIKSKTELAEAIGTFCHIIPTFEKGKRFPTVAQLEALRIKYNVNMAWLVMGEGKMFVAEKAKQEENLILKFIAKFNSHECLFVLQETFTKGFCYYFAIILKERFPESTIYYDQIDGHFIVLYEFKFYDITGHLPKYDTENRGGLWRWDRLEAEDELLFDRIWRDCVMI